MSTRASVVSFLLVSAVLGGYYGVPFFRDKSDKRAHLPGDTSHGHYQIEVACNACHTPFGGVKNDACIKCHGEGLTAENNTHPVEKFSDPRNADKVASLDATTCTTCHREHVPDRTRNGVTIAEDFCTKCHADDIKDRPTHQALAANSCTNSGCHNFHDNRALYEDFLAKHLHEPDQLALPKVALRTAPAPSTHESKPLAAKDHDAPGAVPRVTEALIADWASTAHAKGGINCTGCHQVNDAAAGTARWESKVDHKACAGCHAAEDAGFLKGHHGMRLAAGLSLSPMTPGMARLPMKPERKAEEIGCTSCHQDHKFDTGYAAVDACLTCHDDAHSKAYKASRHFKLWEQERDGKAEKGTGVSCATCHLPREVHKDGPVAVTVVQHDQNANLRPNDKMLRSVCMSCHGLGMSMDALSDRDLIQRNFNGRPSRHVASLDMAEQRSGDKNKKGAGR